MEHFRADDELTERAALYALVQRQLGIDLDAQQLTGAVDGADHDRRQVGDELVGRHAARAGAGRGEIGPLCARLVPPARLELARLAAADFESATSTDFVTRAAAAPLPGVDPAE